MTILDKLPAAVNSAFKGIFYDAVMTVDVVPSSPAYDPADPPAPVPVNYSCKAYVEKYSAYMRANSLVEASDRKVIILADSLAIEPVRNARLTVDQPGYSGSPFALIDYDDGGSNRSVWEIQGRLG